MPAPLSVKQRGDDEQKDRRKKSADHSPGHASCPETGIPWLVLHCSFFRLSCDAFPARLRPGESVPFREEFFSTAPGPFRAAVASLRAHYSHRKDIMCFHFVSRCPFTRKDHRRDAKERPWPSYYRDTLRDTEEKEKASERGRERERAGPMDRVKQVAAQQVLLPCRGVGNPTPRNFKRGFVAAGARGAGCEHAGRKWGVARHSFAVSELTVFLIHLRLRSAASMHTLRRRGRKSGIERNCSNFQLQYRMKVFGPILIVLTFRLL